MLPRNMMVQSEQVQSMPRFSEGDETERGPKVAPPLKGPGAMLGFRV